MQFPAASRFRPSSSALLAAMAALALGCASDVDGDDPSCVGKCDDLTASLGIPALDCWVVVDPTATSPFFRTDQLRCTQRDLSDAPLVPQFMHVVLKSEGNHLKDFLVEDLAGGQAEASFSFFYDKYPIEVEVTLSYSATPVEGLIGADTLRKSVNVFLLQADAAPTQSAPETTYMPFAVWPLEFLNRDASDGVLKFQHTIPQAPEGEIRGRVYLREVGTLIKKAVIVPLDAQELTLVQDLGGVTSDVVLPGPGRYYVDNGAFEAVGEVEEPQGSRVVQCYASEYGFSDDPVEVQVRCVRVLDTETVEVSLSLPEYGVNLEEVHDNLLYEVRLPIADVKLPIQVRAESVFGDGILGLENLSSRTHQGQTLIETIIPKEGGMGTPANIDLPVQIWSLGLSTAPGLSYGTIDLADYSLDLGFALGDRFQMQAGALRLDFGPSPKRFTIAAPAGQESLEGTLSVLRESGQLVKDIAVTVQDGHFQITESGLESL